MSSPPPAAGLKPPAAGLKRLRNRTLGVVAAASLALALALAWLGALDGAERYSLDTRFQVRGATDPAEDLVIVGVDDVTFNELDERWPFDRRRHATVIDQLRKAGAETIVYDVQFTEQTTPAEDARLLGAVDRAESIILATTEVSKGGGHGVLGGERRLRSLGGARAAFAAVINGPGGVVRELEHGFRGLDSFPIAVAEVTSGREIAAEDLPDRHAWIDYAGPAGTYPQISFSRVHDGAFDRSEVAGRTVFVGATSTTLQDVHPVPVSDFEMPGVEILANASATVIEGFGLTSVPVFVEVLIALALVGGAALALQRLSPVAAAATLAGLFAGYLVVSQLAFAGGLVFPVVYPLLALATTGIGGIGTAYMYSSYDRARTRDALTRFVSPEVAAEILDSAAGGPVLGGRRYEVTVLFSDIRGFTSFSEERSPELVLEALNRYLKGMADAILDHGGSISSFMGDGIMAVFGAPVTHTDHADRAYYAALEMLGPRLEEFNEWLTAEELASPFRMGVGLNSGPVMSGLIGSDRRLDYTAIGDTVNTAARLEGMTKGTGRDLLVADSTYRRLVDDSLRTRLEHAGDMEVRGRERSLSVWAPSARDGGAGGGGLP